MKRVIAIVLIAIVAGAIYGIYLYNKKPTDTRDEKADFEITAVELMKEFTTSEEAASKKYVDKVILVSGTISEIDLATATLIIDTTDPLTAITCSFYKEEASALSHKKSGEAVVIKGKCTGKLTDIVLNNCILSNSN
ncbi:MAG: hypothetical protein JSS79_00645 [Bacteroidetes bacterium]|nr:hypothetical protein [Bacteroidota bacterium]